MLRCRLGQPTWSAARSNQNTNGLLRQYVPTGMNLGPVTQEQLDEVADRLNGRPRQTLEVKTPSHVSNELPP